MLTNKRSREEWRLKVLLSATEAEEAAYAPLLGGTTGRFASLPAHGDTPRLTIAPTSGAGALFPCI
jgi:hypothetical protein